MAGRHSPRFVDLVADALTRIPEIDGATLERRLVSNERFTLIDVREAHEFEAGHLPGAVHLSKGVIERDIETKVPDLDSELVLYCGGGYRSALAADNLRRMGYTNVLSLAGGWRAWTEADRPVVRPGADPA